MLVGNQNSDYLIELVQSINNQCYFFHSAIRDRQQRECYETDHYGKQLHLRKSCYLFFLSRNSNICPNHFLRKMSRLLFVVDNFLHMIPAGLCACLERLMTGG